MSKAFNALNLLLAISTLSAALPTSLFPSFATSLLIQEARAEDSDKNTRKLVAFFQHQESPLNKNLIQALRKEYPQFDFHLISGAGQESFSNILAEIQQYKDDHVDELDTMSNTDSIALSDRSLTWGEVKRLLNSSFVFEPNWEYTPIELTGPHMLGTEDNPRWVLRAESEAKLSLETFSLQETEATPIKSLNSSYRLRKEIPIPNMDQVLSVVQQVAGFEVDIYDPGHQEIVLDTLKKLATFRDLQEQNPSDYFVAEISKAINMSSLLASIKQNNILVKASSSEQDPLVSKRSKLGLNVALSGGTVPIWLNSQSAQPAFSPSIFFAGGGHLELQYDVGQFMGFPEFFVTLNGGISAPVMILPIDMQTMPPIPIDQANPNLVIIPQQASALSITTELGLMKRWNINQWLIDFGLSGGALFGILNTGIFNFPSPTQTGFGGTAKLGVGYQVTPEFVLGLDAGFRFYQLGFWSSSHSGFPQPLNFPPLNSWGPVLALRASYSF